MKLQTFCLFSLFFSTWAANERLAISNTMNKRIQLDDNEMIIPEESSEKTQAKFNE